MTGPVALPFVADDVLDAEDYQRLARFIHSRTGIKMPPSKKTFLEGRLRRRLAKTGLGCFRDYCRHLFDQGGMAEEEAALIDAVTTNKTDFFREPHHFSFLAAEILPAQTRDGTRGGQPLKIWSAGCSTGAEPYTIAMVCQEFARREPRFDYQIEASDISVTVLNRAARAIYPHAEIEPVPMELRKLYLLRDELRDEVRIAPELRQKVSFGRVNLIDAPPRPPVEVIFCRNLLIYFDKATQGAVLRRLCGELKPGGYLFLGHSESIIGHGLPLRPVGTTVFRKEAAR